MIKKWQQLLQHLEIKEDAFTELDVNALQLWCTQNVSQAMQAEGSVEERFSTLEKYLTTFFINIAHDTPDNLIEKKPHLRGMNSIQHASLCGYDSYLTEILSTARDAVSMVNIPTEAGMTPLHFAALNGHELTCNVLLKYNAETKALSRLKQTPLHLALTTPSGISPEVRKSKSTIYSILNQRTPELFDHEDNMGNTVIHLMAQNGFIDLLVPLTDRKHPLLTKPNHLRHTPLHSAILNQNFEEARVLTTIPELVVQADKEGRKPIHYAARQRNLETLKACAPIEMNIDDPDQHRMTPLHHAAQAGNLSGAAFLVGREASVSLTDIQKQTALHRAVESGNKELIQWLLRHTHAAINQQDTLGRTALMQFVEPLSSMDEQTEQVIQLFIEKGADLSLSDKRKNTFQSHLTRLHERGVTVNEEWLTPKLDVSINLTIN